MNPSFRRILIPRVLLALLIVVVVALTGCFGNQQSQSPPVSFEQPIAVGLQHKCEGSNAAPCTPQEYVKESYRIGTSLMEQLNRGAEDTQELASKYFRTYSLQNLVVLQLAREDAQALAELGPFLLPELPAEFLVYVASEIYNVPEVRFQGKFSDPFEAYSVNGNYFTPVTLGQAQLDFNTGVTAELLDELGDAFEAVLRDRRHSYRSQGNRNYSSANVTIRTTTQYIQVRDVSPVAPSSTLAATRRTNQRLQSVVVRSAPVSPSPTPNTPNANATPSHSAPNGTAPSTPKPAVVAPSSPQVPRASQAQTTSTQVKPSAVQFGSTERRRNSGNGASIQQSNRSRPAVSSNSSRPTNSRRR